MTKAYKYTLGAKNSGEEEFDSINQSSPAWVLSFARWKNRDPIRISGVSSTATRNLLVVENDCISLSVASNKASHVSTMNAVLLMTDTNYLAAIAPGDFVFVNMLNWEQDARRVADQARANKPINGIDDGFKGLFKIQSVRRSINVSPDGVKMVVFKITGAAFTEFNNTIYFNPYLFLDIDLTGPIFLSNLGNDYNMIVNKKGVINGQEIITYLIQSFIGQGFSEKVAQSKKTTAPSTPNVHFFIPPVIGYLLGLPNVSAAKDIYTMIFGIQNFATMSTLSDKLDPIALNPVDLKERYEKIFYTDRPVGGEGFLKAEYWNQVNCWSILQQYTNSPLNEMFTSFRVDLKGRVMPTVTLRQIPFTGEDFKHNDILVTKFLNLPRWVIDPSIVTSFDIGRDESARVNFVQVFGKSTYNIGGTDISTEIAVGNYVYDVEDVKRNGLRPYIVNSQMDPTKYVAEKLYQSPDWSKIIGDSLIGGHLKFNGTIDTIGIVEPVPVGDNVEFDGVVYHIEAIAHSASINMQGIKIFRTEFALSSGVNADSTILGTRYPEMQYPGAYEYRANEKEEILPGVSEGQNVKSRPNSVDGPIVDQKSFVQPNIPGANPKPKTKSKSNNKGSKK